MSRALQSLDAAVKYCEREGTVYSALSGALPRQNPHHRISDRKQLDDPHANSEREFGEFSP